MLALEEKRILMQSQKQESDLANTAEVAPPGAPRKPPIQFAEGVAIVSATNDGEVFGSNNTHFIEGLAGQLISVASKGPKADEKATTFVAAIVGGTNPKDQIEAMLAAQMAAVHNATMTFARRLNHVDNLPQQDSAARAFNQLARTFAAQVEALKRYRNGGNHSVTVKHVHIHEGGQAVVGNVSSRG
jgi:hypothetical protein